MNKKGGILLGLLIFVVIVASPILYNKGKAKAAPVINLNTPVIQQLSDKECVEPAEYMRQNHMQLLLQWRDAKVRDGQSVYINSKGKAYDISLEGTCLKCHDDKTVSDSVTSNAAKPNVSAPNAATTNLTSDGSNQFCFSCHNYASVKPNCWNCHSDPREAQK
ncbi:sulfate reduction electron transfer complex DsrMKJOP subunit DsrJ [Desulfitobacterium sp. AusDCA]|uniref:sulfate reduction electron transfer complex DsrMKJOP subunit DsrJ n=1 Tax=Desulfitobacterium sp. AusDCA TaxID=3240383 RepID=UPI003DA76B6F